MSKANTKGGHRQPNKRIRDHDNDSDQESTAECQRLFGIKRRRIGSRTPEKIPIPSREPPLHSPAHPTRDNPTYKPSWTTYLPCNTQQPKNRATSPEVPCIIIGKWNNNRTTRQTRSDVGRKHKHKGVRRRVVRRREGEIPVWKLGNVKQAGSHMDLPTTRHCCPIDNRSGVYCILRDGKRPSVDNPVFRRGVGAYIGPNIVWGQRGSNQNDEGTNVPQTYPSHRTQTPFHQGTGGSETNHSPRNQGQGKPSRPLDEITANDDSEGLDEEEFQQLMNEWLQ